jgi:signal peptidase I
MKQIVNIKRVQVDSELKVTVIIEFIAADKESKENIFSLIGMQGDVVEASFLSSQQTLPVEYDYAGLRL